MFRFLLGGYYARSLGPIAIIHPDHANSKENWEGHEKIHYNQLKKNIFHPFMYKFNREYRLKCEAEAYGWQVSHYFLTINEAIKYMVDGNYGFRDKEQALDILQDYT